MAVSVQTPFVAAVVKGTIFSVVSDAKASTVTVKRGKVGVEDIARRRYVISRLGSRRPPAFMPASVSPKRLP